MRRSTSAATPPPPPASASPAPEKPGATKRQRRSFPLGDVTNLPFLRPETPTPIKPRRNPCRSLPAPSSASPSAASSSTCSSSASVTPALNPPSSSVPATPEPSSSSALVTPAPQPPPSASATVTPAPRPPSTASATPAPAPSSTATAAPEPSSAATLTLTPAPKPSFAAVLQEEGESPTICTAYARRRTTEVEVEVEVRSNPTIITNKGKEPVGAAASCPPLGKSTRSTRKKDTQPISSSAPCREAKKKRPLASTPKLPEEFVKKQKAYFADVDAFELVEEEVSESELE